MIVKGYDVKYPIVNVINGVNYYRFTPNETFVVYSGAGSSSDAINYFRFGETTRTSKVLYSSILYLYWLHI